jgi:polyisoprenoid-binding protein YceI
MRTAFIVTSVLVVLGSAAVAGAAGATYPVVESKSSVRIHVGKSGAFSFAGHRHEVQAPVSGTVTADPANLSASSVDLIFGSGRLHVLPDGEPSGDAPKVEEILHGVTQEITVPVKVTLDGRSLTAAGQTTLRHDQFGMKPVSAGGGTVKVANEIHVDFQIVAEER